MPFIAFAHKRLNGWRWWSACALWVAAVCSASYTSASAAQTNTEKTSTEQAAVEVYIMRHALAPGFGDPYNIKLGDCSTQRNLSDAGRAQATAAGEWLRSQGLSAANALVLSSPWCRTLETAELLQLGSVRSTTALSSFFQKGSQSSTMAALSGLLANIASKQPSNTKAVLVTHQVVIAALTGRGVSSGEIMRIGLARDGSFERIIERHVP
ncbi:histidine phosphatase family protein [Comamonadaceae bacterium M7527]|nr:histidine phosphatase family protein [Comamonadaceae bacterium M7527]